MPLDSMDWLIVEPLRRTPEATQAGLAWEPKNEEDSDWVTNQLKKAPDPEDKDTVEA